MHPDSSRSSITQDTKQLNPAAFAAIDDAIAPYLERRQMPGAVFWLERGGETHHRAYGRQSYAADAAAVDLDTVFDAASLTKVIATAPATMLLIEDGKLGMDVPLVTYFPECRGGGKDAITVRHLLTHTSGLNAGLPPRLPDGTGWRGEGAALNLACAQQVTHPPGTFFRYSDINFILLGLLVQRVGGLPLNVFTEQRLYAPLKMTHTGFLPLGRVAAARIAPTQKMLDPARQVLHADLAPDTELRGVVHDPTIRFMGGVGGSAGVFTTIGDLARYARMMLNDGELDGVRVLSRESVRLMRTVQSPAGAPALRTAGWDIGSPYARPRGSVFPLGSYGHTGFTGCFLWIDPYSKTFIALLSNRVYPNDTGNILELYTTLGTLAAQAVTGFDFATVPGALSSNPLSPNQ